MIQVLAVPSGHELCNVKLTGCSRILDLKEKIAKETNIPIIEQILMLDHIELENTASCNVDLSDEGPLMLVRMDAELARATSHIKAGGSLKQLSKKDRESVDTILLAISKNGPAELQYAMPKFLADAELVQQVLDEHPSVLMHFVLYETLCPELWHNISFARAAVAMDGMLLKRVGRCRDAVTSTAVQQNCMALQHASSEGGFREDRETVLGAVRQNGTALCYAADCCKNDPEIVLEAVRSNGMALAHASSALRLDVEIVNTSRRMRGLPPLTV